MDEVVSEWLLELVPGLDGNTLPSLLVTGGTDETDGIDEVVPGTDGAIDELPVLLHAVQPVSATIANIAERISAVFKNFINIYLQVQFLSELGQTILINFVYSYSLPLYSTK